MNLVCICHDLPQEVTHQTQQERHTLGHKPDTRQTVYSTHWLRYNTDCLTALPQNPQLDEQKPGVRTNCVDLCLLPCTRQCQLPWPRALDAIARNRLVTAT